MLNFLARLLKRRNLNSCHSPFHYLLIVDLEVDLEVQTIILCLFRIYQLVMFVFYIFLNIILLNKIYLMAPLSRQVEIFRVNQIHFID